MAEERSVLYKIRPLIDRVPAVKRPEGHVHFRRKLAWTVGVLVLYFVMTNIAIYGLSGETLDVFSSFRAILAGASGSIVHLGIGPIVTGGIIMQLFTGANIINLDLKDEEDRAVYQGTQKILVILMIFVTGIPQVFGFLQPGAGLIAFLDGNEGLAMAVIIAQLSAGGYLIFLMDEVISKWGLGSGVSLFIVAGVSQALFTGTLNWVPANPSAPLSFQNPPGGTIPRTIFTIAEAPTSQLVRGGVYEELFFAGSNPIIALIGTLAIFFFVVYAESTRVELPLAHGRVRGARGRYPIKLFYASVMPIILIAALLANINLFALLLWSGPMANIPFLGRNPAIGSYPPGSTNPISGIAYYTNIVQGVQEWLLPFLNPQRYGQFVPGRELWQIGLHVVVYFTVMVIGSTVFSIFWIETANMGSDKVAEQIQSSGMQIPGFRRDPRVLEKVLDRYIPAVTVIGGAGIGLLAAGADIIGTVGQAGGTGLLLTVGITVKLYEEIAKEQMMEMHPILRGFFGEG